MSSSNKNEGTTTPAASSSNILSPSSNLLVTPSPSQKSLTHVIASGFPIGFFFGTALEKSKVFLPPVIQGQMSMNTFIMVGLSSFFFSSFFFFFLLFSSFFFFFSSFFLFISIQIMNNKFI